MNCPNPHCYNGTLLNAIGEVAGDCPACSGLERICEESGQGCPYFCGTNQCKRLHGSPAPTVAAQPASSEGRSAKVAELRERFAKIDAKDPLNSAISAQWRGLASAALALLSEREADAERWRYLVANWDYYSGLMWKDPAQALPKSVDAALLAEKGPRQ